LEKSRR